MAQRVCHSSSSRSKTRGVYLVAPMEILAASYCTASIDCDRFSVQLSNRTHPYWRIGRIIVLYNQMGYYGISAPFIPKPSSNQGNVDPPRYSTILSGLYAGGPFVEAKVPPASLPTTLTVKPATDPTGGLDQSAASADQLEAAAEIESAAPKTASCPTLSSQGEPQAPSDGEPSIHHPHSHFLSHPVTVDNSFLGRIKHAGKEAQGNTGFLIPKLFSVIYTWGVFPVIKFVVLAALNGAMIYHGVTYLHACPAESWVPIYLLAAGIIGMARIVMDTFLWWCVKSKGTEDSLNYQTRHAQCKLLYYFLDLSGFGWFMAGCYFVLKTFGNYQTDPTNPNFCDTRLYVPAFWLLISHFVIYGFFSIFFVALIHVATNHAKD